MIYGSLSSWRKPWWEIPPLSNSLFARAQVLQQIPPQLTDRGFRGGFRRKSSPALVCGTVDALDAADQEGGFEILDVAAQGGFRHAGGLGQLFQRDFVAGVVGERGEEAVEFLDVADAVELGQVAQQHLVDDVAFDEALR
jgi:hypothetical protein